MKNNQEVYIHLGGDVFAKYSISTAPMEEGKKVNCELIAIDLSSPEYQKLCDDGAVCHPLRHIHMVDCRSNRSYRPAPEHYYTNGYQTRKGVMYTVDNLVQYLAEVADDVWHGIDPRCSAKIPSRLYKNVAHICADALTHLGIPAKVSTLALEPTIHNGLKHQYRVVVDTKVPIYPWKHERVQDVADQNRFTSALHPVYDNINFDFDVTNALRVQWVWPESPQIVGFDVRILREGRPIRWVDTLSRVAEDSRSHFTVRYQSGTPLWAQGDVEALFAQTSIMSVLQEITDGSSEGIINAVTDMFGSYTTTKSARPVVAAMNLK